MNTVLSHSAMDMIQNANTLDDCHQACLMYIKDSAFCNYTFINLNLRSKQTSPANLFTNKHFKVSTFFTTHAYDSYKPALKMSQQQTTPFTSLTDKEECQRFIQATELIQLYQSENVNNFTTLKLYFPFHVRYAYSGFFMLSGNSANESDLYEKVLNGKLFAEYLANKISTLKHHNQHLHKVTLTRKESQCLYILADGGSYEDIGKALNIKADTVAYHIKKITTKIGAKNRFHAIALAISDNQIPPQL